MARFEYLGEIQINKMKDLARKLCRVAVFHVLEPVNIETVIMEDSNRMGIN